MRVVIGEDAVLLRAGMARLLEDAGIEVVAQADGEDLLRKARAHKPDVAIVDIRMPPDYGDEGLRVAETLRAERPDLGVLVLSQHVEEHYIVRLLANGTTGVGYLLKDRIVEVERFVEALARVHEGGSVLDPEVVAEMMGRRRGASALDDLTPRERDVLSLMAEGHTNRAIADRLVVTDRAVERHVTSIFDKLGLAQGDGGHRRVLAVLAYLRG